MIPYGRQEITEADVNAVADVLRSDFLTQGPMVPQFEKSIADYCSVNHVVAVNSATSALHIACLALEVGSGDYVWTTPVSFVASANCAIYCGARIDFVDIDPESYNLGIDALSKKLEEAERNGLLPAVLIVVHFAGQSCDMLAINRLSKKYGFKVIEDASHAIGARYCGRPIGNCDYSDITIFSFHPVKIITTGEGGVATTNSTILANKMRLFRSHGITRNKEEMLIPPEGPWEYQQIDLGFNYRLTDIQAALGLSQMNRLDSYVQKRNELAKLYSELLVDLPVSVPIINADCYSSFHLYVIKLNLNFYNRLEVFNELREAGFGVNVHYMPIYRQPFYKRMGFNLIDFPESERYYSEAITIPLYPTLNRNKVEEIVDYLHKKLNSNRVYRR